MNDLIGLPYIDGGRGPDAYDCWGLVREVYHRHGIEIPDYSISAEACAEISQRVNDEWLAGKKWQELPAPEIPCLVVIRVHPKFVSHLGVYIGYGKFIHVLKTVQVDRISDPKWAKRIQAYGRYTG
jgi:cell wall-associated NlpC family hydrolase